MLDLIAMDADYIRMRMSLRIRNSAKSLVFVLLAGSMSIPAMAAQLSYHPPLFLSKLNPALAHITLQLGAVNASQGESQDIGIKTLIGDRYTVNHSNDKNILLGLACFFDGIQREKLNVQFGLNAFYFAPTQVKGDIIQEKLFTNLSYHYSIVNWPVYLAAKAFYLMNENYSMTFDAGVGPNIIQTNDITETSLDGVTIPDNAFSGQSNMALSATAGFGVRFNKLPIEISYRYFYLGQGYLNRNSNQITSNLSTGNSYANALIISASC